MDLATVWRLFCLLYLRYGTNVFFSFSPRNLNIDTKFPKSVLTLWTSVAKQRGVECIIESGSMSIVYLIVLTPYSDGLIRRPSRSWNTVSFRGDLKDLLVFVERSAEKISKVHVYASTYMYIIALCVCVCVCALAIHFCSLVPSPLPRARRESAWYTLFVHARDYPAFLWDTHILWSYYIH